jgi:hypothetical protein
LVAQDLNTKKVLVKKKVIDGKVMSLSLSCPHLKHVSYKPRFFALPLDSSKVTKFGSLNCSCCGVIGVGFLYRV